MPEVERETIFSKPAVLANFRAYDNLKFGRLTIPVLRTYHMQYKPVIVWIQRNSRQ